MREMKDSGIEWIGKIPIDWEIEKIKYLPNNQPNSFSDGDWIESPVIIDEGIRYYTTGNVGDGNFKEQGSGYISLDTFKKLNCKYAYPGELVFSRLNAPFGRSCILPNSEEKYVLAVDLVILRTNECKKYICYVTQCFGYQKEVENSSSGTTMKRISRTKLGNIAIPLPCLSVQSAIVTFLDSKCSEIEAISADIQKEIETLERYKRSIITEAVTKGLNPDVEMKASQTSWFENIPKSWSTCKTLYVLKQPITDGPHTTPELYDEGIPFVSAEAVSCGNGNIDFEHIRGYISQEFYKECCKKYVPQRHDIYMIKSGATTGKVAIVTTEKVFTIWSPLAVFRCDENKMLPYFLYYSLQSIPFQNQVQDGWNYGTQQNIGMRTLEKLKICKPPLTEQKQIVDYLDKKCSEINIIIEELNSQLKALVSYKKSLIYEYVTGKKEVPMYES